MMMTMATMIKEVNMAKTGMSSGLRKRSLKERLVSWSAFVVVSPIRHSKNGC